MRTKEQGGLRRIRAGKDVTLIQELFILLSKECRVGNAETMYKNPIVDTGLTVTRAVNRGSCIFVAKTIHSGTSTTGTGKRGTLIIYIQYMSST